MYVIYDYSGEYGRTACPNNATAIALHLHKTWKGSGLEDYIKVEVHSVHGPYAPKDLVGKPYVYIFDWKRAMNDLMC